MLLMVRILSRNITEVTLCSSQCLPSGGFHLLHYWLCSLWSFWWCFKFHHREITAESDSFSICDEKVFCGEALWNYISIPFGIKFSLPPPPFPLSQTRLLVSYFVQWIIICYSYDLFWHAEYSRFDQWLPCPFDISPSFFEHIPTFQNNKLFRARLVPSLSQAWNQPFL